MVHHRFRRPRGRRALLAYTALALPAVGGLPSAAAKTSKADWPKIDGVLLMNKNDAPRPLDARPGHDPFAGTDPVYSCDSVHKRGACQSRFVARGAGRVMTNRKGHNELLGGHGSDTIHAGPWGDVLWGDYKPSGQPTTQVDRIYGGQGKDIIYGSHGTNLIHAGGGPDRIRVHWGRGEIWCGNGKAIVYISRKVRRDYKLHSCERVSYRTVGF